MGVANALFKSLNPLRSHLVSENATKSTLQTLFENALGKARHFFRVFTKEKNGLSSDIYRYQHRLPVDFCPKNPGPTLSPESKLISYRPGFIREFAKKCASDSLASALSRETRKKILQGGSGPMLCFVGFSLAKKPSLLTDEQELEGVSFKIREAFSSIPWQNYNKSIFKTFGSSKQFTFDDLRIGELIAKGCNAAVYSASLRDEIYDPEVSPNERDDFVPKMGTEDTLYQSKLIIPHSEGEQNFKNGEFRPLETNKDLHTVEKKIEPYNLAVKVMFNYSAESNAYAIWRAMYKETLPAIAEFSFNETMNHKVRKKRLKPHPNIVEMYFAFADQVRLLPSAIEKYPQALPVRLLNDGCGRNMTLFLVMKRYHCSLKEYLEMHDLTAHTALLLFTQLLEALVHLHQNEVVHRDLKADNILLDLSHGVSSPRLAITDFGCSLESLQLAYPSYEVEKGGNMALMAPEVVSAEAGPFSVIDYSRSDLWTAGTLAYEIFGGENPFYSSSSYLQNASYSECELPPLPEKTPPIIRKLVHDILHVVPDQRPSQKFAATVCQLLLHAPPELLSDSFSKKSNKRALEWMFLMSAKTYLEASLQKPETLSHSLEYELRHTFCTRIQYLDVSDAFKYIFDN